ncbi:MAG: hypothetical protein KGH76_04650 [Thaumarchaeota archaeon]|nr:hypothetical protein [Nitrososphaerota archaeon]MDE1842110.1 hypothetical protein [Nitrososphaerota archaeon]
MVKPVIYGAIGGGVAVAIAVIVIFAIHPATEQYALTVEPRTEMVMGVGNVVRIYVQNTGSSPLTNVKIDYGTTSDTLPVLNPGEHPMFSPPEGTKMVTVTNDQGITVTKSLTDSMQ